MFSSENLIIHNYNGDIWSHLAYEEYLLNNLISGQRVLYIWQTKNAVVIGKHQNPWRECQPGLLKKKGINFARRLTGGGAVYHDTGNLNYSFIVDRESFNFSDQIQIIISVLQNHGVEVNRAENHSLNFRGRKCSGNAFMFRKSKALHHGTLLLNSNLEKLTYHLQPLTCTIKSKAVPSNRAEVTNIEKRNRSLHPEDIGQAIAKVYSESIAGDFAIVEDDRFSSYVTSLREKYASWEWIYGRTPKFEIEIRLNISSGMCDVYLLVVDGYITKTSIDCDCNVRKQNDMLADALSGCRFDSESIASRLTQSTLYNGRDEMLSELAERFSECGI